MGKNNKPAFFSGVSYGLEFETMAKRVPAAIGHRPKLEFLSYLSFSADPK